MEINKINSSFGAILSSAGKTESQTGFREILDQRLGEINPLNKPAADDPRLELLSEGDRILDLLEGYSNALADPGKTLKEIAPMVKEIEDNIHALDSIMSTTHSGDEALHQTLNDLTLTASVATMRFNRGDFIS